MKRKNFWLQMILGFILFLGGLLTYGLHKTNIIDYNLVGGGIWGIVIVGVILIVSAVCDNSFKSTKQEKIEAKDERNIAIKNREKAIAFDTMTFLFVVVLIALNYTGYLSGVSLFAMVGVLLSIQGVFVVSLWYLEKKM